MNGIIIEPTKSIYWAIPKNACTAMKVHFCKLLEIAVPDENPHIAPFNKTEAPIKGYRNWAIVRNPFARLYSLWANKIAPGHPEHPLFINHIDQNVFYALMNEVYSGMSFEDFTKVVLESKCRDNHWKPQAEQIPDNCETFKLEEVGGLLSSMLPVLNGDNQNNWEAAYTQELLDLVYVYYKNDFKILGY